MENLPKKITDSMPDFTFRSYRSMINEAKDFYKFSSYKNYKLENSPYILLRHDIDVSPTACLDIARIENELDVKSTFFLHMHNEFYNLLDELSFNQILEIKNLGHEFGLHFDFNAFTIDNEKKLESKIELEKNYLESYFNIKLTSVSYHNPTESSLKYNQSEYAGLVNSYSKEIYESHEYVSDSNGYWRFKRMQDVFSSREHKKIQALTHPGLWTHNIQTPKDRIFGHFDTRQREIKDQYINFIKNAGRELY